MSDRGQEREALTAAWEEMRPRTPEEFLTPKIYFYAGVSAALAAREEPRSEANVIVTDEDGTHVQSREDTRRPDDVDWDRVRRTLDEAVAAVAPPNVKEIKRIAAALRGWAESSEQRDGELTVEGAEFAVRMADDLYSAVCGEDTERPEVCSHDFQRNPVSEDFGVCSRCGADDTEQHACIDRKALEDALADCQARLSAVSDTTLTALMRDTEHEPEGPLNALCVHCGHRQGKHGGPVGIGFPCEAKDCQCRRFVEQEPER